MQIRKFLSVLARAFVVGARPLFICPIGLAAATFNFDLSPSVDHHHTGSAVIGTSSDTWNAIIADGTRVTVSLSNVLNSRGQSLSETYAGVIEQNEQSISATVENSAGTPTPLALMEDFATGAFRVVLVGLEAGDYTLYVYAHGDTPGAVTAVTIDSGNGGGTATTSVSAEDFRNLEGTNAEGVAYLKFEHLSVASGALFEFHVDGPLNGFQLIREESLSIESQPPSQLSAYENESATITIATDGPDTVVYQWQKRNDPESNWETIDTGNNSTAATDTLVLENVQFADSGWYRVQLTTPFETLFSEPTQFTVEAFLRPIFVEHPESLQILAGSSATFTAETESTDNTTFQWSHEGTPVTGATGASYTIAEAGLSDAGTYRVRATNDFGFTDSETASLALLPNLPSFPGAEGFGAVATGGRGGDVYHVTSLIDSNQAGTLRHAITSAPSTGRTIVFDVSGTIQLNDSITVHQSNLTIAGQTAPAQGITLAGGSLWLEGDNLIVRHLRTRLGANPNDGEDAISIWDGSYVMVDHCTGSWALDETMSMTHHANFNTIQWSLIVEPLEANNHARSSLFRPGSSTPASERTRFHLSVHHNLYAHGSDRNPVMSTYNGHILRADFRNNVVFDWRNQATHTGDLEQYVELNFVSNFYAVGLTTRSDIVANPQIFASGSDDTLIYFNEDNLVDATRDDGLHNGIWDRGAISSRTTDMPFPVAAVTTQSANDAYDWVLDYSGPFWWNRDSGDTRVTTDVREISDPDPEVRAASGRLLLTEADVGGFPVLPEETRADDWDSDRDGMPDAWEIARGLNPLSPDHNGDDDEDTYTNLEEYLNEAGAFPAPILLTFDGDVDNRFARGENWSANWQPSRFDTVDLANQSILIDAPGQKVGNLQIRSTGTLEWSSEGALSVAESLTNFGIIRLVGDATLEVGTQLDNYGTIDVSNWNRTLPENFVNHGVLLDGESIVILGSELNSTGLKLHIHGYAGRIYQLEYSSDLSSEAWQVIGSPLTGNDASLTFHDPLGASRSPVFYRVVEVTF